MSWKHLGAAIGTIFVLGHMTLGRCEATVGQPAPDFSLPATDGKIYALNQGKGHFVVLEWFNPQCPFIKKHYNAGNMQRLQATYTKKGVIWLSIDSSAKGKEGYMEMAEAQADRLDRHSHNTATLLDPSGDVGQLYHATSTPHMFVIGPDGKLLYQGAIDDHPTADPADIPLSKNYVAKALDEAMAGKPVTTPQTKPYGCFVKYAD